MPWFLVWMTRGGWTVPHLDDLCGHLLGRVLVRADFCLLADWERDKSLGRQVNAVCLVQFPQIIFVDVVLRGPAARRYSSPTDVVASGKVNSQGRSPGVAPPNHLATD